MLENNKALSRRSFVGGSLLSGALLAASLAGCDDDEQTGGPGTVDPGSIDWDLEVDVLVAGSGAAGLVAAYTMAKAGLAVTVVDRNKEPGGCSVLAGGACGFAGPLGTADNPWPDYSVEDALEYWNGLDDPVAKKNDPALIRKYVESIPNAMDLIIEVGCDFDYSPGARPSIAFYDHPDEPGPGLTYKFLGADKGDTCGSGLVRPFQYSAVDLGVELLQEHQLVKLYREVSGRVVGALVDNNGTAINIKAAKGVLLASSGWKGSEQLRRAFDPRIPAHMKHTGAPYAINDGSGIIAALEVGASFASDQSNDSALWRVKFGTPWYNYRLNSEYAPPGIFPTAAQSNRFIFVNNSGERFVSEAREISNAAYADYALRQDDCISWMVFDSAGAEQHGWDVTPPQCDPDYAFMADSLAELASMISVPAIALEAAVDRYNGFVETGTDIDFGKPADKLTDKIEQGPFYAVRALLFVHDTAGGLMINENAQVLDLYGEPIPGLYAAGDAAGGISVIGLPRAVVTGYLAGAHLAG